MLSTHPDKQFVAMILDHANNGVPLGYEGPREYREQHNWPSAFQHRQAVQDNILKDIQKGRKFGPFKCPPFNNWVGSPMGAFKKRSSPNKCRVIYDLSWPPNTSINKFINIDCSVQYINIDAAIKLIKHYGRGAQMGKIDLEDAFKHIIVRPDDWELLGTTWYHTNDDGSVNKDYYIDTVLPFGAKSSPRLFNNFADALEYAMRVNGVTDIIHYLDDYFTIGPRNSMLCESNMNIMLNTCKTIGFGVQHKKVVGPSTEIEFLGIVLDSNLMQMRISNERLENVITDIEELQKKRSATKREVLSIIGKLIYVSRVVKSGRTFTRRLIEQSKTAKHLHHRIKINSEMRRDLQWWLDYLPSWNGIALFYDDDWTSNMVLVLLSKTKSFL